MSPLLVRRIVAVVCAVCVVGMIAAAVAGSLTTVVGTGLVTVVSVLCLLVATAVGGPTLPNTGEDGGPEQDRVGAEVEAGVAGLVSAGVDEVRVRRLVAGAVHLGRLLERS